MRHTHETPPSRAGAKKYFYKYISLPHGYTVEHVAKGSVDASVKTSMSSAINPNETNPNKLRVPSVIKCWNI